MPNEIEGSFEAEKDDTSRQHIESSRDGINTSKHMVRSREERTEYKLLKNQNIVTLGNSERHEGIILIVNSLNVLRRLHRLLARSLGSNPGLWKGQMMENFQEVIVIF